MRLPRSSRPPLLAACAALAVAACEPATAGAPLAAEYALREANGAAPPVVLASSPTYDGRGAETITLIAASFRFDGAGGVRYSATIRSTVTAPARDSVFTTVADLEYWRTGDRVEIGSRRPCPPNALCAGNFVGRVVGDRIVISSGESGLLRADRQVYVATR